jgi:hypothetical protein
MASRLENSAGVNTGQPEPIASAASIANQVAGRGKLKIAEDGRDRMARRKHGQSLASGSEQSIGGDQQCGGVQLDWR